MVLHTARAHEAAPEIEEVLAGEIREVRGTLRESEDRSELRLVHLGPAEEYEETSFEDPELERLAQHLLGVTTAPT